MSCPYCRYEGSHEDASYMNKDIFNDDDLIVCFMLDGGMTVWFYRHGVFETKYIPVNYCPMCGRKL